MLMDIAREIEDSSEIMSCFFLLKQSYTTPPPQKKGGGIKDSNMISISLCIFYLCVSMYIYMYSRFFRWGIVRGSYINFLCMGVGWGDIIGLFLVNFNFTCLLS